MKKKAIIISSIVASVALIAFGAYALFGGKLTAVTEEYDSAEYQADNKAIYVTCKPVILPEGKSYQGKSITAEMGGGTFSGGGVLNVGDSLTTDVPKALDGYKFDRYEIAVNGTVKNVYTDFSGKWDVKAVDASTGYNILNRVISTNESVTIYAVFVKSVETGLRIVFEPEVTDYISVYQSYGNGSGSSASKYSGQRSQLYYVSGQYKMNLKIQRSYEMYKNGWRITSWDYYSPEGEKRDPNWGSSFSIGGDGAYIESTIDDVYELKYESNYMKNDFNGTVIVHWKAPSSKEHSISLHAEPEVGGTVSATKVDSDKSFQTTLAAKPNVGYKFAYWEVDYGALPNVITEQFTTTIEGVHTYTAHFEKSIYSVEASQLTPIEGGKILSGLGHYVYGDSPTIKIVANDGYELESCTYVTSRNVQYKTTYEPGTTSCDFKLQKPIDDDVYLQVVFRTLRYKITGKVETDAPTGAAVTIENTSTKDSGREVEARDGDFIRVTAVVPNGYTLRYFTDSKGEIYRPRTGDKFIEVTASGKETYTAHYNSNVLKMHVETNLNDASICDITVEYNGTTETYLSKTFEIKREEGKDVTLIANEKDTTYKFIKWIITDSDGNQEEELKNRIDIPTTSSKMTKNGTYSYRAIYELRKIQVTAVMSNPSVGEVIMFSSDNAGNNFTSSDGSLEFYPANELVVICKPQKDNIWVTKWELNGAELPRAGKNDKEEAYLDTETGYMAFKMTVGSGLKDGDKIAIKVQKLQSKVSAYSSPADYGSVSINGCAEASTVSGEVYSFEPVELFAYPNTGKRFKEWRVDGKSVSSDSIYILSSIDDDTNFEAVFVDETYNIFVESNNYTYGDVDVQEDRGEGYIALSESRVHYGSNVKMTATVDDDTKYRFDHWENKATHEVLSRDPEYVITNYTGPDNMAYRAIFVDITPVLVNIVPDDNAYAKYVNIIAEDGTKYNLGQTNPVSLTTNKGSLLRLKAELISGAPYSFDQWHAEKAEGGSISLTNIDSDVEVDVLEFDLGKNPIEATIKVRLKEIKYIISAKSSPTNGGTVNIKTEGGGTRYEAKKNELVKLYADPEPGYVFDYWWDGTQRLEGVPDIYDSDVNILTLPSVSSDESITAYFVKEKVKIEYEEFPKNTWEHADEAITAEFYGVEPDEEGYYPSNTRVTFTAREKLFYDSTSKYKFIRWEWQDGKSGNKITSTDNPVDFTNITSDVKVLAVYRKQTHKVRFDLSNDYATLNLPGYEGNQTIDNSEHWIECNYVDDGVTMRIEYTPLTYTEDNETKRYVIDYIKDNKGNIYSDIKWNESSKKYSFTTPAIYDDMTYTAVMSKPSGTLKISASPAEAGLIRYGGNDYVSSAEYNITTGSNVTVEAKVIDSSYRFKYFEYIYPERYKDPTVMEKPTHYSTSNNPFTLYKAGDAWVEDTKTKEVEIIAVFEKVNSKVNVVSDPQTGGRAYMFKDNETADITGDGFAEMNVDVDESFTLIAVPNEGYKFDHFTDSKGTIYDVELTGDDYSQGYLKIPSVSEDTTYTAHFVKDYVNINVYTNPTGGGTFIFKNDNVTEKEAEIGGFAVDYDSNFTITAYPKAGYKFERWDIVEKGGNKSSSSSNPLNVSGIKKDTDYTAVFTPIKGKVRTIASPLDGGTVVLDDGLTERDYESGETITITAIPNDGYSFDCLKDSKGVKYEGTGNPNTGEYTFSIPEVTGDETFTGYFVKNELKITVACVPTEGGLLEVEGTPVESGYTAIIDGSGSITVSVKPRDPEIYKFVRWEDEDGNVYTMNPLTLSNIKKNMKLTAILDKKESKVGIKVVCSPAIGGHATKVINDTGSATISATANTGYKFVYWKKDGVIIAKTATTTVTDLTDGTVYTACFTRDTNYNPKSSTLDEDYYDTRRRKTDPNYSVTENTIKQQASAQIQVDRSRLDNELPAAKTYAAYGKVAEYFEQHRKNDNYIFGDGELFTTQNEKMPIKMIPTETDVLARAEEFSYNKYGKLYNTEILAAVDVTLPSDFAEGPRTYIWRNVEANFKDNIYVLYLTSNNDDYKWATAVYDMFDDVEEQYEALRFTIPGNGRVVRIVAVRVTIPED